MSFVWGAGGFLPKDYDTEFGCTGRDNYYVFIFGPLGSHSAEISVISYPQRNFGNKLIDYGIGSAFFSAISFFLRGLFTQEIQLEKEDTTERNLGN